MASTDSLRTTIDATAHTFEVQVFDRVFFGNTVQAWLCACSICVLVLALLGFGRKFTISSLRKFAARTSTRADDLLVVLIAKTHWLFFLVVALFAGAQALSLHSGADALVRRIAIIACVLQAALWSNHGLSFWLTGTLARRTEQDGAQTATVHGLVFLMRMFLWIIAVLLMLDNVGVNISTLVTGLGIGGVAVALAVQNILGDLLASLSIILDKPFVVGDFIIIDTHAGTVEHVGLKTTRLRSLSGEQLVFSNTDLLKSRIRNFKRMTERRVAFTLELIHGTPVEKLMRIPSYIEEVVAAVSKVRFERSHLKEIGGNGIVFETVYHVLDADYLAYANIHQMVNLGVLARLREEGLELAFPTRTVFINGAVSK